MHTAAHAYAVVKTYRIYKAAVFLQKFCKLYKAQIAACNKDPFFHFKAFLSVYASAKLYGSAYNHNMKKVRLLLHKRR